MLDNREYTTVTSEERETRWSPWLLQLSAGRSDGSYGKENSSRRHLSHSAGETRQNIRTLKWLEFITAEYRALKGKKLQKAPQGPPWIFGWILSCVCVKQDPPHTRPGKKNERLVINSTIWNSHRTWWCFDCNKTKQRLSEQLGHSVEMSKGHALVVEIIQPLRKKKKSYNTLVLSFKANLQRIKLIHR